MIHLRPTLGGMRQSGGNGRIGDYFLHLAAPSLYRISDTTEDAQLERPSALDLYRVSSDFPGNGGIVNVGGFFRIQAA